MNIQVPPLLKIHVCRANCVEGNKKKRTMFERREETSSYNSTLKHSETSHYFRSAAAPEGSEKNRKTENGQTSPGSFSALSKPILAIKYWLDGSRQDVTQISNDSQNLADMLLNVAEISTKFEMLNFQRDYVGIPGSVTNNARPRCGSSFS